MSILMGDPKGSRYASMGREQLQRELADRDRKLMEAEKRTDRITKELIWARDHYKAQWRSALNLYRVTERELAKLTAKVKKLRGQIKLKES